MSFYDNVKSKFDALFNQPLPIAQLVDPTRSLQITTADYLNVPEGKRVIKNTVPPQSKSKREQCGYSRRDVVSILDRIEKRRLAQKDSMLLPERDTKSYRALAAGNVDVSELARNHGMSGTAFKVFVAGIEKTIIDEAAFLRKRCGIRVDDILHVPDDAEADAAYERLNEETRAADEDSIAASGGASIGGRIVSRGKDSTGKTRKLDTFERGGKLTEERHQETEASNTSRQVEHDDYSEDSSA